MNNHPYILGERYIVRTDERFYVGKLMQVFEGEIVLKDAWSADNKHYEHPLSPAISDEELHDFMDDIVINRNKISDMTLWRLGLPVREYDTVD